MAPDLGFSSQAHAVPLNLGPSRFRVAFMANHTVQIAHQPVPLAATTILSGDEDFAIYSLAPPLLHPGQPSVQPDKETSFP